ncbi:MAG: hypothetical protein ACUZ77_08905 [Candidatus Brocadiales bacterium]
MDKLCLSVLFLTMFATVNLLQVRHGQTSLSMPPVFLQGDSISKCEGSSQYAMKRRRGTRFFASLRMTGEEVS